MKKFKKKKHSHLSLSLYRYLQPAETKTSLERHIHSNTRPLNYLTEKSLMVTLKNGHVKIKQIASVSHSKTDAPTSQIQQTLCYTMTKL